MEKRKIETALRDYHWMVKEIARLRNVLTGAGERIVKQYGIESSMPKGSGTTSDPVHLEVERREKLWGRVEKLEKKVLLIQSRIHLITDDREKTVLDCMLDGMSYRGIARHMGFSEKHIRNLKDSIVDRMSNESANSALSAKLHNEKLCS